MQKGLYTIESQSGANIDIAFTTWTFRKFSQRKSMSVDQLFKYIQGKNEEGFFFTHEDMLSLMLIGAEYMCLKKGEPFRFTDIDACDWMDDLGGLSGQKLKEMTVVMISALFDLDQTHVAKVISVEEKKSEQAGTTSTSLPHKPVSGRKKPKK